MDMEVMMTENDAVEDIPDKIEVSEACVRVPLHRQPVFSFPQICFVAKD